MVRHRNVRTLFPRKLSTGRGVSELRAKFEFETRVCSGLLSCGIEKNFDLVWTVVITKKVLQIRFSVLMDLVKLPKKPRILHLPKDTRINKEADDRPATV